MQNKQVKIDLHTHSKASDGLLTPTELLTMAIANNIKVLSLTDHDTLLGINEAIVYSKDKNITFIPGIEFSVKTTQGSYHLLGYNIDHTYKPLLEKLQHLATMRETRADRIVDDLQKHGFNISREEVCVECTEGAIGRPHIARVLVKNGYAENITEVFQKFLIPGTPGYVPKEKITLEDAIKLTYDAGGIPVIAHPHSLEFENLDKFENFLKENIEYGIKGIEAYSSMHTLEECAEYVKLAKRYNLLITGGSDYHGDKDETIGYYITNELIPATYIDNFLQALK